MKPDVVFTRHARERCEQRGIDTKDVVVAIKAAAATGLLPPDTKGDRMLVQFGKRRIVVAAEPRKESKRRFTAIVVTVAERDSKPRARISRRERNKRQRAKRRSGKYEPQHPWRYPRNEQESDE